MTFRARIALAMAGVVLVAIAVVAAAGGGRVRRAYLDALRGSLEARIDAVAQSQSDRRARAKEELERLVRSPRLVAVMLAGDPEALRKTAADELRPVLERAGAGAGFAFVPDGGGAPAAEGLAGDELSGAVEAARALLKSDRASAVAFRSAGGRPWELLAAAIVDRAEDTRIGALVLASPVRLPDPMTLADGTVLEAGLDVAGTLFGTALPEDARAAVSRALGAGSAEVDLAAGTEPALALGRPIPGADGATLVVLAGLGPLRAAERGLLVTAGVAGAVAVAVGVVASLALARGLARPVAALSAAAVRIEQGDFAVRVRDSGHDELSVLARRFNGMAEGLAQRERFRRVLDTVTDPGVAAELVAGKLDLGGTEQAVGVLFCDIRGFTPLTERMTPHEVIAMLNEHMTLLTDVAYAHGGTVDKFVGDLVMVVFGAPRGAPDDALRMVRCARAMVDARERANAGSARPIRIGIGCAYGPVVAGCMGSARRMDYTVLGTRVNLAARLCSKAPAMHVYVDAATRAAAGCGGYAALPPLEVKGFSEPVEAFDLLSSEESA